MSAQKEGDAEVAQTISHKRVLEPMGEHVAAHLPVPQVVEGVLVSVNFHMPQVVEEVVEVAEITPERIMEHIVSEVPVPQFSQDIAEVSRFSPQRHLQAHISEQSMDDHVPPLKEEMMEVVPPFPQERTQA